jgi:hypothetical protein
MARLPRGSSPGVCRVIARINPLPPRADPARAGEPEVKAGPSLTRWAPSQNSSAVISFARPSPKIACASAPTGAPSNRQAPPHPRPQPRRITRASRDRAGPPHLRAQRTAHRAARSRLPLGLAGETRSCFALPMRCERSFLAAAIVPCRSDRRLRRRAIANAPRIRRRAVGRRSIGSTCLPAARALDRKVGGGSMR